MAKKTAPPIQESARAKISQADVPGCSLDDALRVPRAIAEHYGFRATKPLNVAAGMGIQPNSGSFRMLAGAAIAYGLTSGGPNAPEISITPLGMRIVRPTVEGDDLKARREATLKPRVVGEFLRRYNDAPIPREDIGMNVLHDMGVPRDRAKAVFDLIISSAESVGLIRDIRSKRYISLDGAATADAAVDEPIDADELLEPELPPAGSAVGARSQAPPPTGAVEIQKAQKRVFVTHGKNRAFIEPIKKLLTFGELDAVVSV